MAITLACWNLCGLSKIEDNAEVYAWLMAHKVIFIEESVHIAVPSLFKNFTVHEFPARVTGGRRSGGLILLIANEWLRDAEIEEVSHERYVISGRISFDNLSVVLCNVYAPVQSDDCPEHIDVLMESRLATIAQRYAGDTIIIGNWRIPVVIICLNYLE